jgi:hypothetical protein
MRGEKSGLWIGLMLLLLVTSTLFAGTVTAVNGAEAEDVTRYAPVTPASDEEFEVTLRISGEFPLVVGIVETIPDGFSFPPSDVSTTPYNISGQKIAFAAINETEIKYTVRAPSSDKGTFTGIWIDILSDKEGSIAETTITVGEGAGAIEEEVTPTPSPSPSPGPTTSPPSEVPGFEAIFVTVSLIIAFMYLFVFKKRREG